MIAGVSDERLAVRPGQYANQARTYDLTRGASPTVVRLLARTLGPPGDRTLLDIAGGTGNYAQVMRARGFRPVVLDAEPEMVRRSVPKLGRGRQVAADAMALPFDDRSFDAAIMVISLHLIDDQDRALGEARRVLRDGPFALVAFTQENVQALFVGEYFPSARITLEANPPRAELERRLGKAGFSNVESETFVYLDTADGSLAALHTDAFHLAGPAYLRNNSFFHRISEEERREGLARLEADLRAGVLERKVKASFQKAVVAGHGTVFAAWP
jgi:SAM-dependent methyltransferase